MAEVDLSALRTLFEPHRQKVIDLSHNIHAHPELAFEEYRALNWCAEALGEAGIEVEGGICDLPTAFRATLGEGKLTIAICAEYDALPGIGHACGHNIIAASAVGAGIILSKLVDDLGVKVIILGTPAEEGGGGKILMMDRGAFDGVDAAMMIHPAPVHNITMHCRALEQFEVHFEGKEAHASASPELGRNALDAQVVSQVALGLLRQHLSKGDQYHGIITKGGDAPNIVPDHTSSSYYIRSSTLAQLGELRKRVMACFEAGAMATGTSLNINELGPAYSEFKHDDLLGQSYRKSAADLGVELPINDIIGLSASTDMANVSLKIPSIHPLVGIDSNGSMNHQSAFAQACVTQSADDAVVFSSLAMALTAIDYAAAKLKTLQ